MRQLTTILAFSFALLLAAPLQAQFRSAMRQANKEFELHAYNSAVVSYQQALDRRDDDLEALSKIAKSFMMLNKMAQANQFYTKAVKDRKVSDETRLEHAHVLRALGRYDEAKQWYLYYAQEADPVIGNHFAKSCDFAKQQAATEGVYMATSSAANSPTSDFGPSFVGREQLIFSSFRTDKGGTFTGQAQNQPLVAAFGPSGVLQEPFKLQSGYDGGNVGPVSYSSDGSMVLFTRNNFTDGTRMIPEAGAQLTLWFAEVNPNGQWVNARPLPFNSGDFSTGYGMFAPDGQSIYFASDREGGYGGFDIYRAQRSGNGWSLIPENLGTIINSVGNEITPYFDGANLYFSSDWHFGMGAYDVFRTEMQNGRPSNLLHMGKNINSSRDDYGFVFDATRNMGYVVSNRIGGRGNEDLYRISQASDDLVMVIRSASDGSAVSGAIVDLTACGDQAYYADINGRYSFRAVAGTNCELTISKEGYLPVSLNVASLTSNGNSGEVPVMLSKISEAFQGRIVDAQSRIGINSALVQTVNRGTGNVSEVRTDGNGNYSVAMQPYNTYDFSISAPGYETLNFPLAMADGSDRNVLGVLSLLPGQNIPPVPGDDNDYGGPVGSGYSVQLASLSKEPDMGKFAVLSDLGQVYSKPENGVYKVRMGIFQTRAEAEAAKAALAGRGYPKTFIVADTGTTGGRPLPDQPEDNAAGTYQPPVSGANGPYFVQLGAYSTPRYFDAAKAQRIGTLVQRQRGNLTLMLLSARTPNEAQQLKNTAQANGYDKAFIVQDVNGTLQKL
ncbi:hypothetical protein CEQ90_01115 [Lewinellaceae bacterium SD302]|nr:hypothetical protein CEQ90_01115 [Lewinellaceae bacterium SD302]